MDIFEFGALCDNSEFYVITFRNSWKKGGLFLDLSLLYIQDLKEMVSAYGGSNPIQWKTTEYPIPKVRLEHHDFYVLNIIGITSCESEFYFFCCVSSPMYIPQIILGLL